MRRLQGAFLTGSSRAYFDALGGEWDRLREGLFSEAVRVKALQVAGVEHGALAVDVGAGTGFITAALIEAGLTDVQVEDPGEQCCGTSCSGESAALRMFVATGVVAVRQ